MEGISSLGPRLGIAVLALLACAFFGLGIRQSHDLDAATAIASAAHPSAAQAAHAERLLDSAGTLNPDRTVQITRAQLVLARGQAAHARAILADVIHDEPQNLDAWILMVRASADDRSEREIAFARALVLSNSKVP
jgi:predicted Zn-dependent protease